MTARAGLRRWFAPVPMLAGVVVIASTCALGRW
ncbi:SURF1 family protein, partial [Ralstonia pseudosolanacearum]